MWAQNWKHLYNITAPYSENPWEHATNVMRTQVWKSAPIYGKQVNTKKDACNCNGLFLWRDIPWPKWCKLLEHFFILWGFLHYRGHFGKTPFLKEKIRKCLVNLLYGTCTTVMISGDTNDFYLLMFMSIVRSCTFL